MKLQSFPPSAREFPVWLKEKLSTPPTNGIHGWLFDVARNLHAHLPAAEIVRLLESKTQHCRRHVPRGEIVAAVQNALPCAWQPTGRSAPTKPTPRWPRVNQEQRDAIIRDGGGLADLWEVSPVRIDDNVARTEEIIDRLFPGNPSRNSHELPKVSKVSKVSSDTYCQKCHPL